MRCFIYIVIAVFAVIAFFKFVDIGKFFLYAGIGVVGLVVLILLIGAAQDSQATGWKPPTDKIIFGGTKYKVKFDGSNSIIEPLDETIETPPETNVSDTFK